MYWIYLIVFISIVFVPKIIQHGVFFLQEEDVESLALFSYGMLLFVLYFVKEKALFRVLQEKLHLQKKTNTVAKDLSDSYSYIGGLNRKFDIVKDFIFDIPEDIADVLLAKKTETYQSVLDTVKLLSKTETVSLRFVNIRKRTIEKCIENGSSREFLSFDAPMLLSSKKIFLEKNGHAIVRSTRQAKGVVAFIIFPKVTNQVEDMDMFKILASQSLLLFCVDKYTSSRNNTKLPSEKEEL